MVDGDQVDHSTDVSSTMAATVVGHFCRQFSMRKKNKKKIVKKLQRYDSTASSSCASTVTDWSPSNNSDSNRNSKSGDINSCDVISHRNSKHCDDIMNSKSSDMIDSNRSSKNGDILNSKSSDINSNRNSKSSEKRLSVRLELTADVVHAPLWLVTDHFVSEHVAHEHVSVVPEPSYADPVFPVAPNAHGAGASHEAAKDESDPKMAKRTQVSKKKKKINSDIIS